MSGPVANEASDLPVLYSFRRCPYAIRARLTLAYCGVPVALREVVLRDKPAAMLEASPKGTVPVMVLASGEVLEESLDIMSWALGSNDPDAWLDTDPRVANELITGNDDDFKIWLDRYKYAERFPEESAEHYREQGERFLRALEERLQRHTFLLGERHTFVDTALAPFVRQFAFADIDWFQASPYVALNGWLQRFLDSELFKRVMCKYPAWTPGDAITVFP
ncbi:MAG: glutathione S-transferase [Gammaproteobacteria bacterium]